MGKATGQTHSEKLNYFRCGGGSAAASTHKLPLQMEPCNKKNKAEEPRKKAAQSFM
jgi:hypothetical protein